MRDSHWQRDARLGRPAATADAVSTHSYSRPVDAYLQAAAGGRRGAPRAGSFEKAEAESAAARHASLHTDYEQERFSLHGLEGSGGAAAAASGGRGKPPLGRKRKRAGAVADGDGDAAGAACAWRAHALRLDCGQGGHHKQLRLWSSRCANATKP
jgi:hypothetical protein